MALLEDAVESTRALGAPGARARAERDLAGLLWRRGERDRASALLQSAGEIATSLGMTGLQRQIDADERRPSAATPGSPGSAG